MLNASQGESRMETTLSSSHVCQHWRNIILSSHSLWGRLVISTPKRKRDCIEEIILRSGSSPLWVEAVLDDTIPEFTTILGRHWGRIERLEMNGAAIHLIQEHHISALWEVLHRPAPLLRSFSFINTDHARSSIQNRGPLFAFDAPLLRTLVTNVIILPNSCPLFPHLRTLSWRLYGTLQEMFHCLKNLRFVECIVLRRTMMTEIVDRKILDDLPRISLPHLTSLNMSFSALEPFVALFDRITVAPTGCIGDIRMEIRSRGEALNNCLRELGHSLAKFVRNYVKHQSQRSKPHSLKIRVRNDQFDFNLDSGASEIRTSWRNYQGRHRAPSSRYLKLFFAAYITPNLSHITHLNIQPSTTCLENRYFKHFLYFLSYSSLSSSVTHLVTPIGFFRLLYQHNIQKHEGTLPSFDELYIEYLFPKLHTLHVKIPMLSTPLFFDLGLTSDWHILLHFLRTRKAAARGPSVLRIKDSVKEMPYFCDLLGEIPSLEIIWE